MYKLALTFPSPCYYSFVRVSFSFVMNEQRTQSYHRRLNAIHRAFPDNKSCFSERAEFVHAFLPTIRRPASKFSQPLSAIQTSFQRESVRDGEEGGSDDIPDVLVGTSKKKRTKTRDKGQRIRERVCGRFNGLWREREIKRERERGAKDGGLWKNRETPRHSRLDNRIDNCSHGVIVAWWSALDGGARDEKH